MSLLKKPANVTRNCGIVDGVGYMDERNEIEGIKYINAGTFTSATVSLLKSLSMLWETVAMWMVWVT